MATAAQIKITHLPSGQIIAQGPRGWGITSFEGNYYIRRRHVKTTGFKINYLPGICPYKFVYVWLDFNWKYGKSKNLGWLYWLPNPLLPFIWFRIAVPQQHPDLHIESIDAISEVSADNR
jgi:uncharacterized protein (DUF427 family)